MRRLLALPIFLALGPLPGTHQRFPVDNLTDSVAAVPLAVPPARWGSLRFDRGWKLTSPHSRFGAFRRWRAPGRDGSSSSATMAIGRG